MRRRRNSLKISSSCLPVVFQSISKSQLDFPKRTKLSRNSLLIFPALLATNRCAMEVYFFGREPVILRDRVVYTSFDASTVQAIRDLHRVEVLSYESFVERYKKDLEKHSSRLTSEANEPRSSFSLAEDDRSDLSIPSTIPVRDDYGDNERRSRARLSSNSRGNSRFRDKPPGFNRSTSDFFAQMFTRANLVAGMLVMLAVLLVVEGPDILDYLRSSMNKSRNGVTRRDFSNNESPKIDQKQEPSNATNSEKDLQCLKSTNPPPTISDKDARLKSITDIDGKIRNFLKSRQRYFDEFDRGDMQTLGALVQRERDYLRCLDGK